MNRKNHESRRTTALLLIITLLLEISTAKTNNKNSNKKSKTGKSKKEPSKVHLTKSTLKKVNSANDTPLTVFDFNLDGKIEQLTFCGKSFDQMLALTSKQDVFHTSDFGKSWICKREELDNLHSSKKLHIVSLYQNNNDHDKIILFDRSGEHLITSDCGKTFLKLSQNHNFTKVMFHPFNSSILAASDNGSSFFISKDGALTWTKIRFGVSNFIFAKYSEEAFFSAKNRMFALERVNTSTAEVSYNLLYSDDFFDKSYTMMVGVERYVVTRCCIFVRKSEGNWMVSDTFGWSYNFYDTRIFDNDVNQLDGFQIIDNDVTWYPMSTFEFNHNGIQLNKLAKANFWGTKLETITQNLVCQFGKCDFLPLHGLSGIMIINKFDQDYIDYVIDIPQFIYQNSNPVLDFESLRDFRQTLISFNFGELFQPVKAPKYDADGREIRCNKCSLHIHLQSSRQTYSLPKANRDVPGIIIASGSIGDHLREEEDGNSNLGLFVSENAGFEWRMIARGTYVFEILDRGSLIIYASPKSPTTFIFYSIDTGRSSKMLQISNEPVEIISISVNEKQFIRKFVVQARARTENGWKYKIFTVDFSNLVERECQINKTNPSESDYVEWLPFSDEESKCWNGREISILIKKPEVKCFNPQNFVSFHTKRLCECSENDFHCDYGYQRNEAGLCIKNNLLSPDPEFPLLCEGSYYVTSGYTKNLESYCSGGVEHGPIKKPCPISIGSKIPGSFYFLAKLAIVIGLIYYCFKQGYAWFFIDLIENVKKRVSDWKSQRVFKSKEYCELKKSDGFIDTPRLANGYSELKKDMNSIFEEDEEEASKI